MPGKLFERTLVIRGGALGDFLLTLPALRALRDASAHLEILAYPEFVQLACQRELVHAGKSIEYGPLAGFFARGAAQDPALRSHFASFDLVLSYLYDPDGIFAENLRNAGARHLVAGPHRPAGRTHAMEELCTPLGKLGIDLPDLAVQLGRPHAAGVRDFLIAIHPGSGSLVKNWATANWQGLADKLLAADGQIRIAVIGGEADRGALQALAALRQNDRVEFWEHLPLTALAGKLETVGCYIGHDTGVSHLAAVLGVPSLLLFGPTDPAVWAPPHAHVRTLRAAEGDLSALGLPAVFAAAEKHLLPRLLASAAGTQHNPPR